MKALKVLTLAAAVIVLGSATAFSGPTDYSVKWSQLPDTSIDHALSSYGVVDGDLTNVEVGENVAADDWKCLNGLPVTDFHWWGTYWGEGPEVQGPGAYAFEISIHADIPAADGFPSHPGALLWSTVAKVGAGQNEVQESLYTTGDEPTYQYNYQLDEPFNQDMNSIYWLDLIGLGQRLPENMGDIDWGWRTAAGYDPIGGPLDAAVSLFGYDAATGAYEAWGSIYGVGDPPVYVPLAFEVSTVPEPGTLALVGTAALGLLAVIRRRALK